MTVKTFNTNLPAIGEEGSLPSYLQQIKKFPMLPAEEEYMLAKSWVDRGDVKSAQKLVTSHLRLVAKIAMGYRGYGLPVSELVSEGNIGLMRAVKKFDPEKGFRLATYAMWWIKASIQEYVLKSWSLVKMGTTTAQKKLFFNLKKIKKQILDLSRDYMGQDELNKVSKMLNIKAIEIQNMESRLTGGDVFLNQPIGDEEGNDLMSLLPDSSPNPEESSEKHYDSKSKQKWLSKAISTLNHREKIIIKSRKLAEKSITLGELGLSLKISKERVRQIETSALKKLKLAILEISQQNKEFFI